MSILSQHPAYQKLKDLKAFEMIIDELVTRPNYSFVTFEEMLIEFANDVTNEFKAGNESCSYGFIMNKDNEEKVGAKIKGDIFEILSMYMLQSLGSLDDLSVKSGTFFQELDEDDIGLDFKGIYGRNSNDIVCGQVKFRDPKIKLTPVNTPFNRITFVKLLGEAVNKYNFDKKKDHLIFVTNLIADDAMHFTLKNNIGWSGVSADEQHHYIKVCDRTVFESKFGYNAFDTWMDLKECFN